MWSAGRKRNDEIEARIEEQRKHDRENTQVWPSVFTGSWYERICTIHDLRLLSQDCFEIFFDHHGRLGLPDCAKLVPPLVRSSGMRPSTQNRGELTQVPGGRAGSH